MFAIEMMECRTSVSQPDAFFFGRSVHTFRNGREYAEFMRGVRKVLRHYSIPVTVTTRKLSRYDLQMRGLDR
jgi:RNase P/RNase MRP subunit p30